MEKDSKIFKKGQRVFHVGNGHYWSIQMVDRKNNRFSLVRESEDGFKTFKMTSAIKNLIHEKEHKAMKERAYQSALKKNHELKDCIAVGKAVEAKTVHKFPFTIGQHVYHTAKKKDFIIHKLNRNGHHMIYRRVEGGTDYVSAIEKYLIPIEDKPNYIAKQVSDYELVLPETRSAGVDYLVRSMFILAHVYKHGPVTSQDIQSIFSGLCLRTVQRMLKPLVGLGYLNGIKGEGVTVQITYELNEQYVPWVAEYVKTLPLKA